MSRRPSLEVRLARAGLDGGRALEDLTVAGLLVDVAGLAEPWRVLDPLGVALEVAPTGASIREGSLSSASNSLKPRLY